ncbi:TetR-like C-terminal domain-containing protein [Deinococcus sp. Arct2-2]|uniref:TetR-like C-terminal domain-containing protein n=1 Tax=Deinococcus sp. Arct2-2 TaxID=2568653 RepID=UPI001F11589A|nr:TetR-like C-terminal domain-containing protein [Deinococcus sp. Arct2-2]
MTALVQDGLARLDLESSEAVAQVNDPREKLRALGVAYIRFAVAHPAQFRIMFRPELSHPPAVSDLEHGPVFGVLMKVVDELGASHTLAHDRLTTAITAWSLVHGLAALLVDGPLQPLAQDRQQVDQLAQAVTAQLLI